jgi:uncharacterized protein (TIGR02246 family)
MTALVTLALSVALASQAGAAGSGSSADEEAIRRATDAFSAAWGRHDAKALTASYTADADFTNPVGGQARGRAEIEKMFGQDHGPTGPFRSSTIKQTIDRIRFVKPDVAVVHGAWETSGAVDAQGASLNPSPRGRLMLVFVKQGGDWKVASGQAMQPVPMGPPPARD